jgi:hypothetical protein
MTTRRGQGCTTILDANEEVYAVRRALKNTNKKRKAGHISAQFKYGVPSPKKHQTGDGVRQDKRQHSLAGFKLETRSNGSRVLWNSSDPDHKCGSDYQRTTLL